MATTTLPEIAKLDLDSPEQQLIRYISKFIPLKQTEIEQLLSAIKFQAFKKGALLLKEGQVAQICHFVLKGCVRQYYLADGIEKTTNFYTEGEPVAPYEGNFEGKPSKYYLECVEDCILTESAPGSEEAFFAMFPHLQPVRNAATEHEWSKSQERFTSFILNSPEERYLDLLNTRPDLLDRVPQYQLASYLGVTPESLSRIRKRIMEK
jgi:CRP-like cAMP-binding protein